MPIQYRTDIKYLDEMAKGDKVRIYYDHWGWDDIIYEVVSPGAFPLLRHPTGRESRWSPKCRCVKEA